MIFIYLDTNVYCRPFDDQQQARIRNESDAFEKIIDSVKEEKIALISSDILFFEVSNILKFYKRTEVEKFISLCKNRIEENDEIKELAILLRDQCDIKDRDALHLASAILSETEYYLTCDDDVTRRRNAACVEKVANENGKIITILNPEDFKL